MTTLFNKSVTQGFVLRTPEGVYLSVRTGIGFGRTDVSETHELRRASVHARFLNHVEKEALRKTGYVNFEHVPVEITRTVELIVSFENNPYQRNANGTYKDNPQPSTVDTKF